MAMSCSSKEEIRKELGIAACSLWYSPVVGSSIITEKQLKHDLCIYVYIYITIYKYLYINKQTYPAKSHDKSTLIFSSKSLKDSTAQLQTDLIPAKFQLSSPTYS